jgi:hypothetical protein
MVPPGIELRRFRGAAEALWLAAERPVRRAAGASRRWCGAPKRPLVSEWVYSNLDHFLALALLVARGADILSTYLVTPSLKLEANGLARRMGWKFAAITLPVCFVPYLHLGTGFACVVFFLLVAGGNFKGVWLARAIGESRYLDLLRQAARDGNERDFAVAVAGHAVMFSAFGTLLLFFCRNSDTWGFYAAQGVLLYAFAVFLHTCLFYRRLQKAVPPAV